MPLSLARIAAVVPNFLAMLARVLPVLTVYVVGRGVGRAVGPPEGAALAEASAEAPDPADDAGAALAEFRLGLAPAALARGLDDAPGAPAIPASPPLDSLASTIATKAIPSRIDQDGLTGRAVRPEGRHGDVEPAAVEHHRGAPGARRVDGRIRVRG